MSLLMMLDRLLLMVRGPKKLYSLICQGTVFADLSGGGCGYLAIWLG